MPHLGGQLTHKRAAVTQFFFPKIFGLDVIFRNMWLLGEWLPLQIRVFFECQQKVAKTGELRLWPQQSESLDDFFFNAIPNGSRYPIGKCACGIDVYNNATRLRGRVKAQHSTIRACMSFYAIPNNQFWAYKTAISIWMSVVVTMISLLSTPVAALTELVCILFLD